MTASVPTLEFFFFYGSIHSYLSVMRIEELAMHAGIQIHWRPFNLRRLLTEQNNTAFANNSVRLDYNWRDIERRAAKLRIPFAGRPPYPVDPHLTALRVGIVAAAEGWCAEYTKATFRAWFLDRKAPGVDNNVNEVIRLLRRSPREVMAKASRRATVELLDTETEAARQLGVFGAPSMIVAAELFWGDDRLDDAIEYARRP